MLIGRPTKNGTGIEIFGDYWDLKSLYNTVHSLSGAEDTPGNGLLMNFAYEIRKANDNHRETDTFDFADELIIYRGFKIFWIHLFATVQFMRESAGLLITSSDIQADIYRLESIVENCVKEYDQKVGAEIHNWLTLHKILRTDYIELLIMHLTYKNLQMKDGKPRFKNLKVQLETLFYNHPDHLDFKKFLDAEAKRLNCSIKDLDLEIDYDKTGFNW